MTGNAEPVLWVENLTKRYSSEDETIGELVALNGINFTINKGEIVGIIGNNGAGKSTLLKVLSEITAPSSGMVKYKGRISSVLDIGTGFHPDLSGKENVYLNGALLGFSKKQVEAVYDKIVAFSELEAFMEMPVKQYSSGMYLRLAFSVAFQFQADIILLDEILAVGDASFKQKSIALIQDFIKQGKTIILVSHNMELIAELCHRCIWLEKGSVKMEGKASTVVDCYLKSAIKSFSFNGLDHELFHLSKFSMVDDKFESLVSEERILEFQLKKKSTLNSYQIFLSIYNANGQRLLLDSPYIQNRYIPDEKSKTSVIYQCIIPEHWLSPGTYSIGIMITKDYEEVLVEEPSFGMFNIIEDPSTYNKLNKLTGTLHPQLNWVMK